MIDEFDLICVMLFSEYSVVKSFHIRSICFLKWGGVWKKRGKRGAGRGEGLKRREVLIFRRICKTVLMIIFTIVLS